MKKLLSVLLSAALLIGITGLTGCNLAKDEFLFEYKEELGGIEITGFRMGFGHPSAIEIPTKLDGESVVSIGAGAFSGISGVSKIEIPLTVKYIGDGAFSNGDFSEITIPIGVTSIGKGAFANTNIEEITIPFTVTSIGEGAFSYCHRLAGINVHEDNEYFTSENGVLFDKAKTILIAFPINKSVIYEIPDTVTRIGESAFAHYKGISVTLPESLTEIGDFAFAFSDALKTITIPANVTSIGDGAFSFIETLEEITVDSGNVSFIIENGGLLDRAMTTFIAYPAAMRGERYEIPDGVTHIAHGAFSLSQLTEIIIPDSVTSIGIRAFQECLSLVEIRIPDSVTSIGNRAFFRCDSLERVVFRNIEYSYENISELYAAINDDG